MNPAPDPRGDRIATIFFADLLGFEALAAQRGPDEAFAIVTRCLRRLDEIARRHGGAVDKYLGDCLMAVFGFPVASARAEEEAVAAAEEMLRAVEDTRRELDLGDAFSVRIGANTGEILAGELGGAVIREFAVIGDAVNVAARLKDLAPPGRAWVGPLTHEAAEGAFEWNAQDVLKLKGRQQSIQPWELVGTRDRARIAVAAFCPLIGRDTERDALVERLDALGAGRGGAVWIGGEAGTGKSRLLAEALAARPNLDVRTPSPNAPAPALAPGPDARVILVEEAERAGAEAWTTLGEALAVSLAWPVLIVIVARPGGPPGLEALRARVRELGERHLELELGPLHGPDLERLVDAVAGDDPLDDDVRALVLERSGGNPSHAIQGVFLADALQADAARAEAHSKRGDEAERRRTTVLFADLAGFTSLAETTDRTTLHDLVTSCLDRMSAVARRHGGTVEKYLGDCVLAVFGAPVAIEDAPRAAVNAAIEMRDSVAAFNRERDLASPLGIHTGIDTGLGIAGDVSGPVIREFTLLGASVNRSAHLKGVAPTGDIWVGEETWRATRDVFDFDQVDPDAAGRVFEVRSSQTRLHRDACDRQSCGNGLQEYAEACDHGIDNGIDGLCDASCAYVGGGTACSDGVDNDGDGKVDAADPGCASGTDTSERGARVCDDGVDNDGDYRSDAGGDPGCGASPKSLREDPACNDGIDNEGDGKVDYDGYGGFYEPDPDCDIPNKNEETSSSRGLGFELMLLLPLLARMGALRRRRSA